MAFNGSGTFNRVHNWVTDLGNSVKITASRVDAETDGIATGLSTCITKDGQTTITANIPMNTKKFTGMNTGNARTDSITLGQVQDNSFGHLGENGGVADTYTASPSPAITAYVTGQRYTILIGSGDSCTGASTLNISGVGAKDWKKFDGVSATTTFEANDLLAGGIYDSIYDGTQFVTFNPEKRTISSAGKLTVTGDLTTDSLVIPSKSELTISSGAVTPTDSHHTIDTESDASTDDLDTLTITNLQAGSIIILSIANSARNVVIKHNTGNIITKGGEDITLDVTNDRFVGISDGTNVVEISRTLLTPQNRVSSKIISNDPTIDFTTVFVAGFNYEIVLTDVQPASDVDINIRFEVSSSFQTTSYVGIIIQASPIDSVVSVDTGTTSIGLTGFTAESTTTKGYSGEIFFANPANTGTHKKVHHAGGYDNSSGNYTTINGSGSYEGGTGAVTGIQILASTGNLLTGTITITSKPI